MFRLNRYTKLFYSPDDITGITVPTTANDILDELGKDEPEITELDKDDKTSKTDKSKTEKTGEEETEKTEEETKSLEDELEEDLEDEIIDDDKLELAVPLRKKEILAKYPTLFKDFPDLEKSYYRERAFSEFFATPAEAKQASEDVEILKSFETDLSTGNTENILASVKKINPKAFLKVADDYLPTLARVDKDAYHHVIGNIIKTTILQMAREGKTSENETLSVAAQILNQFVFGSNTFEPITNLAGDDDKPDSKTAEIDKREQEFNRRQFETAQNDLDSKCSNAIKSWFDKNMDPKDSMTDYVRSRAIKEAQINVSELIENDSRFKTILDRLWQKAFEDNFSQASKDKIKSAYLSKAKTLLPAVLKKHRNEALKGLGKRVKDDDDDTDRKGPLPVGRNRTSTSSSISGKTGSSDKEKARAIPKDVSSKDYLMQD